MTNETTQEVKEVSSKKAKASERLWSVPRLGVSVMASSLEEAVKKANKQTNN